MVTDTPNVAPDVTTISLAEEHWLDMVTDLVERRVMRRGSNVG
jgi:hypothetical protein